MLEENYNDDVYVPYDDEATSSPSYSPSSPSYEPLLYLSN